ncbi:MAG: DUF4838 domain-containing protein [Planctomycetota bacterium]
MLKQPSVPLVSVFILASCVLWAQEDRLFDVVPPEKAAFNYPDPPREGRADYFTIVENGQARCAIVHPIGKALETRRAAATLKAYLDLATGADIPLIDEAKPVPPRLAAIHLGDTAVGLKTDLALPDVRYGDDVIANINGYLVKTLDEKTLVIRGKTDRATALGAVGFLKRYVGVRHYWAGSPGDLGDVIPKTPTLRIPEVEWCDWPYFVSRVMSGLNQFGPKIKPEYKRLRTDDFFRMNYSIPSNESYYRWLPVTQYGATHPEYFPLFDGKRFVPITPAEGPEKGKVPQGWQPCVSNPEVAQVMAEGLIDYFRKNPDAIAINLAVNDGMGDCMCENCRAMDAPNADQVNRIGLCDRYVKFSNRVCEIVEKEFPAKIIAFIAYGSMRMPPETVKLHRMLMPVLCVGSKMNAFEQWDQWMRMGARRMGIYCYHDDQGYFIMPKLDIRQSAKRIRYIVASGRARHFYQEMYPFWPMDGMVPYVENELLWDPRQDVDVILEEYYTRFFGPAGPAMKEFYDTLEAGYERWIEQEGLPHWYGKDKGSLSDGRSFEQFKVLNPAEADKAEAHLKRAAAAAQDAPLVAERVDIVRRIFEFAAIGARQYGAVTRLQNAKIESEADAEKVVADAREAIALGRTHADYKRDVMEKPPASIYAPFLRPTNIFHDAVQEGIIHPQVVQAVGDAFDRAATFLQKSLGPTAAAAWWKKQRENVTDPALSGVLKVSETKATGIAPENQIKDPSFELRGEGKSPKDGRPLEPDHQQERGLRLWHRRGTPFHWALTKAEAHTGAYSVEFSDSALGGITEPVAAGASRCFRVSVWLKHNDKEATYQMVVYQTAQGKRSPRATVNAALLPNEWQQISTDFLAPMEGGTITLHVFAIGQTPGAKVWVDDVFLGSYPP